MMVRNTKILTISLPSDLVNNLDKEIEKLGHGTTRSGFIGEALKRYFEGKK